MSLPVWFVRWFVFLASRVFGPPVPVRLQRLWLTLLYVGAPLPPGITVQRTRLGGRPAERVTPGDGGGNGGGNAVLLLHGGGFLIGSPHTHRVLAAHVAAACGAPVFTLDYRLAPEHPFPAALDDAAAAYDELSAHSAVSVVGDSAGGALALLLAMRLRDERAASPAGLVLISPVADLTLGSSGSYRGRETVVRAEWVRSGVDAFLAGADPAALSPLSARLAGLPPVLLQLAEHERLRPEGERLAERLREAGVPTDVEVLPGLWHDVQLQAHLLAEGAEAAARVGRWLRSRGRSQAA